MVLCDAGRRVFILVTLMSSADCTCNLFDTDYKPTSKVLQSTAKKVAVDCKKVAVNCKCPVAFQYAFSY